MSRRKPPEYRSPFALDIRDQDTPADQAYWVRLREVYVQSGMQSDLNAMLSQVTIDNPPLASMQKRITSGSAHAVVALLSLISAVALSFLAASSRWWLLASLMAVLSMGWNVWCSTKEI